MALTAYRWWDRGSCSLSATPLLLPGGGDCLIKQSTRGLNELCARGAQVATPFWAAVPGLFPCKTEVEPQRAEAKSFDKQRCLFQILRRFRRAAGIGAAQLRHDQLVNREALRRRRQYRSAAFVQQG